MKKCRNEKSNFKFQSISNIPQKYSIFLYSFQLSSLWGSVEEHFFYSQEDVIFSRKYLSYSIQILSRSIIYKINFDLLEEEDDVSSAFYTRDRSCMFNCFSEVKTGN